MKIFYILLFALFLINKINAQCTSFPVINAVTNGDFELGNLPQAQLGFTTGYTQQNACKNTSCWSNAGNFVIGTTSNDLCYSCNGMTPQTIPHGGSYAMYIDGAGNATTIWQETINVIPNQTYYFSAWVALLDQLSPPILQFYVNGAPLGSPKDFSVNEPSVGVWTQIYATWASGSATTATISFKELTSNPNVAQGDDFAVDDISFINSQQNINPNTSTIPNLGSNLNICSTNGTITLDSKLAKGLGNFYWYEGTGNIQTAAITSSGIITNPGTQNNTITINNPGTYRVCFDDGVHATASSMVVISDTIIPPLTDVVLCSPAIATLNASVTGSQNSYAWSVPSGAINPGNSPTATAKLTGTYTVTVTGISGNGWGCVGKAASNVTSTLPTYDASKIALAFCRNTNTTINGLGTGADSANFIWYSAATGGNVLSAGANPSLTFPGSGSSYTVYLLDATTNPLTGSPLINQSLSAFGSSGNTAIFFTVHKTIQLQTVTVLQQTWTGGCMGSGSKPVVVNLLQGSTIINSTNATITCGTASQVTLNFTITPGNYQLQVIGGTGNSGPAFGSTNYTFTASSIAGWIDITSSNNAGYNGPFSKINIVKSNSCDLIPVIIPIKKCCTCPSPVTPDSVSACLNSALNIKIKPNGANNPTFYWNGPNGFTASTSDSTLNVSSNAATNMQGKYFVYSLSADTCQSINDSVLVKVNLLPTVTANLATITLCSGQQLTLFGGGAMIYQWNNLITDNSPFTPTVGKTVYIVTGTDINNCANTAQATVKVNPLPTVTANPSDTTICSGQGLTLFGGGAPIYQWDKGISDHVPFTPSVGTTTYTVTGTDENNCANTAKAIVTVNSLPATPVISQAHDTLVSNAPSGNQWYMTSGSILNATNSFYIPQATDDYYTIVAANGCMSDKSNIIHVVITGITEKGINENLTIYPNPTRNNFTIEMDNLKESYTLEILNTMGQVVLIKQINNPVEQVDLTGQAAGVYFVKVQTENNTIVKKIIKE